MASSSDVAPNTPTEFGHYILHQPRADESHTDHHYACAAGSESGVSVVRYTVKRGTDGTNITVAVINQRHQDPETGSGEPVMESTEDTRTTTIQPGSFKFGRPCCSDDGSTMLLDGGHAVGSPFCLYAWKRQPKDGELCCLEFSREETAGIESTLTVDDVSLHLFKTPDRDKNTSNTVGFAYLSCKDYDEGKTLKCDLDHHALEMVEESYLCWFKVLSKVKDRVLLLDNYNRIHVRDDRNVTLTDIKVRDEDQGFCDNLRPVSAEGGFLSQASTGPQVNGHGDNQTADSPGTLVVMGRSHPDKACIYVKNPGESTLNLARIYENMGKTQTRSIKFSLSDDGQALAVALKTPDDNIFIDIYHVPIGRDSKYNRFKPSHFFGKLDKDGSNRVLPKYKVCEIGSITWAPDIPNKPKRLAVSFRTKSRFVVTMHEVQFDNDACLGSGHFKWLRKDCPLWNATKLCYYDLQATRCNLVVTGTNIGAFSIPY